MRRLALIVLLALALLGALAAGTGRLANPIKQMPPAHFGSRAEAEQAADAAWRGLAEAERPYLATEWAEKALTIDGKTLRWLEQRFGDNPAEGWSLFISMHGGGA